MLPLVAWLSVSPVAHPAGSAGSVSVTGDPPPGRGMVRAVEPDDAFVVWSLSNLHLFFAAAPWEPVIARLLRILEEASKASRSCRGDARVRGS